MWIAGVLLFTLGCGAFLHFSTDDDPIDIVRRRLANGDISKNEFDEIIERIKRMVQK